MQTLAFEVITNDDDLDSDLKVSAISLLTDACGLREWCLVKNSISLLNQCKQMKNY